MCKILNCQPCIKEEDSQSVHGQNHHSSAITDVTIIEKVSFSHCLYIRLPQMYDRTMLFKLGHEWGVQVQRGYSGVPLAPKQIQCIFQVHQFTQWLSNEK